MWVVGKKREFLVFSKRIITSAEKIFGYLSVTEWLFESSGRRVTLDTGDLVLRSVLGA